MSPPAPYSMGYGRTAPLLDRRLLVKSAAVKPLEAREGPSPRKGRSRLASSRGMKLVTPAPTPAPRISLKKGKGR